MPVKTAPKKKISKPLKKRAKASAKTPAKPAPTAPRIPAKSAIVAVIPKASRVQFAANGRALLVARESKKTLTLWDVATGTETPPLGTTPTFSAAALSADNRYVAMGTSTGILAVDSSQTGKALWKTRANGEGIGEIVFTLDSTLVIAAPAYDEKREGWIRVHRVATGEEEKAFDPVAGAMCCHLALSPDGLFLAHSEMRSKSVLIWHLPTRQMGACIPLAPGRGRIVDLAFGIGVKQLFIAQEKQISGWNGENGTRLITMEAPDDAAGFVSVALIGHGGAVATARIAAEKKKGFLEIWGAETGHLRKTIPLPVTALPEGGLVASPDGSLLALATGKDCWVWRVDKLT